MLSPTPRLFASELIYLRATASPSLWEEGRMLRLKSLRLLLTLAQEGPLCELRAARVQALKLELMDLLLPEESDGLRRIPQAGRSLCRYGGCAV